MRKFLKTIICALMLVSTVLVTGCSSDGGSTGGTVKIGVIRTDATSGEAVAWENYLNTVGAKLGYEFSFSTTNDATEDVAAIETYASKGYNGIFLLSENARVAAITKCNEYGLYVVLPTGALTDDELAQVKDFEYFLGSVAPTSDDEYKAGYDMAKFFVENGSTEFTLFGGATCYASDMHVQRLAGMLAYLCEDSSTSYDGAKTRADLIAKIAGVGVDPAKFVSNTYKVCSYMDGFNFDETFSTKLSQGIAAGGTTILSVGAGDAVTGIASGIASGLGVSIKVGCVDAITSDYEGLFSMGYTYCCGKYASAMAPALIIMDNALNGNKITDASGNVPTVSLTYWVATSAEQMAEMLANDNATDGYLYNDGVIINYRGCSYDQLKSIAEATYEEALAIRG